MPILLLIATYYIVVLSAEGAVINLEIKIKFFTLIKMFYWLNFDNCIYIFICKNRHLFKWSKYKYIIFVYLYMLKYLNICFIVWIFSNTFWNKQFKLCIFTQNTPTMGILYLYNNTVEGTIFMLWNSQP